MDQVRGLNLTKNGLLKSYKHTIWDLLEGQDAFNIQSVPRNKNKHVDRLTIVGAQYDVLEHLGERKGSYFNKLFNGFV